ncbi:MAG: hypothetical protein Q9N02_01620 [Ghiorsea sp.]|nr:hypothetical protein [Ghiorsea sp.]
MTIVTHALNTFFRHSLEEGNPQIARHDRLMDARLREHDGKSIHE